MPGAATGPAPGRSPQASGESPFLLDAAPLQHFYQELPLSDSSSSSSPSSLSICIGRYSKRVRAVHLATQGERLIHTWKRRARQLKNKQDTGEVLCHFDHPHILRFFESFEDPKRAEIVTEECAGKTLFEWIGSDGYLGERECRVIIRQLLSALLYCHQRGVAHRDINLDSVFMQRKGEEGDVLTKLSGFDFAKRVGERQGGTRGGSVTFSTRTSSPYFFAPEMLDGSGYGMEADMWALGVVTYTLLCGYPPFFGDTDKAIADSILSGTYTFYREDWKTVSESAKDLIRLLLVSEASKRITAAKALSHPWIAEIRPEVPRRIPVVPFLTSLLQRFYGVPRLPRLILVLATSLLDCSFRKKTKEEDKEEGVSIRGTAPDETLLEALEQARHLFVQFDRDGDGVFSINDLHVCLKEREEIEKEEFKNSAGLPEDFPEKLFQNEIVTATVKAQKQTDPFSLFLFTEFLASCLLLRNLQKQMLSLGRAAFLLLGPERKGSGSSTFLVARPSSAFLKIPPSRWRLLAPFKHTDSMTLPPNPDALKQLDEDFRKASALNDGLITSSFFENCLAVM
uniref:Protein kinase domain-containing protein n=1 Tax=Chromera velia CCMP2878 TaxID=1169474 RepID=A0A0G4FAM0_9ALVE|eukprot:Cvel_15925.t1-p1 / transcript=Cvel_15925.t1 / gene=Cvel_15925 / organism=Chromera_velia_CCMP2878 / gene_product=Calcium-dependent protein kinase 2, putative / transcript_product=Calcium-dependent protein kinase 2, putative / location=Cvel_scaffold1204:29356-31952(+) / protein_length=568 / sequence_SO=supercontig / SO=protein_coding / is_pseudo=false